MSGYLAPPRVWPAIKHALATPALAEKAQQLWAKQAQHLFKPHKLELSASSAGACVLEVWAKLHGKLDIPEDWEARVLKMDGGTMYGAWIAALFAVGYEDLFEGVTVEVEVVGEHDGIPGHVEMVIDELDPQHDQNPRWVVEVKTSFWGGAVTESGAFKHSKEFHVLQAAKEALIVNAPGFSVLNVYPAATKNKNPTPFIQDDFVTAEWTAAVTAEYNRLQRATLSEPPQADPPEAWRCNFCRFSACDKNRNPLKPQPVPAAFAS